MAYYLTLLFNNLLIFLQDGGHEKPSLLSVNPGLIIWTIIIFVLLLVLLRKIAWKPLLGALTSREESIKNSLDNAEKLKKEAEELIEQNKKNLAEANAKSMEIINQAKEVANKLGDELKQKANEDAHKIIEQAKAEIEQQKNSAMDDLKDKISDIAIEAAEKIISESLDKEKQKKLVNDFLSKVPNNN